MANVSLAQFHQVFFEESLEGLDTMETALLALDQGIEDSELVHGIFRAAHSIKGGAATFGFPEMAAFTHEAESLLDELRDGRRAIDDATVELLLRTVDCLRGMFARAQGGDCLSNEQSAQIGAALAAMLGRAPSSTQPDAASPTSADGWQIYFRPHASMLAGGNEPLRLLRELAQLGPLQTGVELDQLPALATLDPTQCHLGWRLQLRGQATRAAITSVFDWVEDECDLSIEALAPTLPDALPQTAEVPTAPVKSAGPIGITRPAAPESSSVRVSIDKIDGLINLVGELMITQSMLDPFRETIDLAALDPAQLALLQQGLTQLARHTRELQENVMGVRMLPIGSVFNRFPRLVRDLSGKLGKSVRLDMRGEHTELDKSVLEKIGDPLVHLVRNAIDHGMEMPEVRRSAGKHEQGTLRLHAHQQAGAIVVEVSDDGAGLDNEAIVAKAVQRGIIRSGDGLSDQAIAQLIFEPGFSTASVATDLSGRGVGMDVVRRNVADLGGSIRIDSRRGQGSAFVITLPLTLAIIDGLIAGVGEERYIVPLVSIVESIQLQKDALRSVAGGGQLFRFRGDFLPLIRLHQAFGCDGARRDLEQGLVIVVEGDGTRAGLFVDGLIGQQQAVVKSLEANYRRVDGVSGATILADGSVALIVDVPGLMRLQGRRRAA